jgi:nitroreductase
MTHVSDAVARRISTRAFTDAPVSQALLRELLEKAQRAPSGGNLQPWRVIALTGAPLRALSDTALATLQANPTGEPTDRAVYPEALWEPYRSRRFAVGEALYATLGIPREDKFARLAWFTNNYRLFGAPVGLFLVMDTRMGHGQWGHAGMYLQTLCLLAQEAGLGTCMQECWGILRTTLHRALSLGEHEMVWCGVALGWPDPDAPVNTLRTQRATLEEVVDWRGWE